MYDYTKSIRSYDVTSDTFAHLGFTNQLVKIKIKTRGYYEINFEINTFFESYAKNNFYKTTENLINLKHQNDTHPPLYLRANVTVQQFDEFHKTFNIKKRDGMYLKEDARIEF